MFVATLASNERHQRPFVTVFEETTDEAADELTLRVYASGRSFAAAPYDAAGDGWGFHDDEAHRVMLRVEQGEGRVPRILPEKAAASRDGRATTSRS